MGDTENQRKVFEFFLEHMRSQESFTKQEIVEKTSWTEKTLNTYWPKQFKGFVVPVGKNKFRVSEAFRPYTNWDSFRDIVTQVRRVSSDYTTIIYDNVIIYEFFMPLTNEGHLRTALDALFYKDTILSRLKTLEIDKLHQHFNPESGEATDIYLDRVCEWIADRIGGYSISHVSGRFRSAELSTMQEAAKIQQQGGKYLEDETTAVVRFIFPCGEPHIKKPPLSASHFEDPAESGGPDEPIDADTIRWFFGVLFVQSIIQVINGEDEIWMIESGIRNRLHIWRVES